MPIASLAMYVSPPPVAEATAALWAFLRDHLRHAGLADVPDRLDATIRYDEAWLSPDLLLAQTCGYPYVRRLTGRVRLVATPVYGLPGCDGPTTRSFIIVGRDSAAGGLADLRGARAAINEPGSNSGANLFRATIAPLAKDGRFFGSVTETGGHRASMEAVADGRADAAAIDCVTFGNTARFDPGLTGRLRILAETPAGPGLPLITRADAPDAMVAQLRAALDAAIADASLASVRDTLALCGFARLSDADYAALSRLEADAVRRGYPAVA
ncbi:phosphate/phosphite/phosphonate ABC transporter substrate-binding protein [Ensifer soli]|uniref:phosphate/phosphite/phosphonate ABC transporter substrate-binding protein n=1 Tax=Ciceribacter sp. sgz301302 TaxID=3342379 RepID=UPI0035B72C25